MVNEYVNELADWCDDLEEKDTSFKKAPKVAPSYIPPI